jgi:hypothetical protein
MFRSKILKVSSFSLTLIGRQGRIGNLCCSNYQTAIGKIRFESMHNSPIFASKYPADRRPSMEHWAKLHADEEREVFEKDRQQGMIFVKVSWRDFW